MRKILIIISMLVMTGCQSNVKGNWDCPALKSGGCVSMKENDYISKPQNENDKPRNDESAFNKKSKLKESFNVLKNLPLVQDDQGNQIIANNELRDKENVSKIWFTPFIDDEDNLHDESFVYFLEKSSDWRGM